MKNLDTGEPFDLKHVATIAKHTKSVFIIPLEKIDHSRADNARFTYFLKGLEEKYNIIGLERIPYFDTSNSITRLLKFLCYSAQTLCLGIRRAKQIDLIFTQHVAFSTIGALLSLFLRKPLVCDIDEGNIIAHCHVIQSSKLFLWTSLFLEKVIGFSAAVLVIPSQKDLELYSEQHFRYQNKLKVLPSGIDLDAVPKVSSDISCLRQKLGLSIDKKLLIYMGKREYFPNKEAAFWINDSLAPLLAQRFKDVQILIGGSGEVPQSVHPAVHFLGHVPDIYEYIYASDICIVPYKLNTGISLKVLDAMACARPVVTMSNVAKLFSYVIDGENMVIAKDREDFPVKVINLLENPGSWKIIGQNGKRLIENHYNWTIIKNQWKSIVGDLVTNG